MGIDNRVVGAAITALRMRAGMTQQQLAASLNVTHQAVSKWENGAALPDIQTLLTITQLFGLTMEQLLSGELPDDHAEPTPPEAQDEPQESAAQNEKPSISKWLRDTLPRETYEALEGAANKAKQTAINIGETIAAKANEVVAGKSRGAQEDADEADDDIEIDITGELDEDDADADDICDDNTEVPEPETDETDGTQDADDSEGADEGADEESYIDIDKVIQMAPFMTRQTLGELVLAHADKLEWRHLTKLAPFLPRNVIDEVAQKLMQTSADKDIMRRLAPFMSSDTLLKIVANNLDQMDWDTLRRMAPHLRRDVVDKLTILLSSGKAKCVVIKNNSRLNEVVGGTLCDLGNIFSEIGGTVSESVKSALASLNPDRSGAPKTASADESAAPKPEQTPPKPSELKDKVARAALAAGNWDWLSAHLCEIGDRALILEIALAAARSGDDHEAHINIIMRAASLLDKDQLLTLFGALLEAGAWKTLIALKHTANEAIADQVLTRAAQATDANREGAYQAIKVYASKASTATLEALTEQGLKDSDWQLINALTDSL